MRKLFAAFGMSFAKVGHTICRLACCVGKAESALAVRVNAKAVVHSHHCQVLKHRKIFFML